MSITFLFSILHIVPYYIEWDFLYLYIKERKSSHTIEREKKYGAHIYHQYTHVLQTKYVMVMHSRLHKKRIF